MVDATEKEIIKSSYDIAEKVSMEIDKAIDANRTIIENSKDTSVSLNQTKEKVEKERKILKIVLDSPETPLKELSDEDLISIKRAYNDDQKKIYTN